MVIGDLCNGSTPDSDSVCGGSNPSSPAKSNPLQTQRLQGISFICNGFPSLLCILSVNQNII